MAKTKAGAKKALTTTARKVAKEPIKKDKSKREQKMERKISKVFSDGSSNEEIKSEVIELLSNSDGTIEIFSDSSYGNEELSQQDKQTLSAGDLERLR